MVKICKPKEYVGLGFRWLQDKNKVALAHVTWRFFIESDKLWVRMLRAKYGDPRDIKKEKIISSQSHNCATLWRIIAISRKMWMGYR